MLAEAHLARGDRGRSEAHARSVLNAAREMNDEAMLYAAGTLMLRLGDQKELGAIISTLDERIDEEGRLYGKLLRGEQLLEQKKMREALDIFRDAQSLGDTWLGRYGLGRSYLFLNAFAEAQSELEACVKRRGEAAAVFLNDRPTMRVYSPVLYYVARCEEGLGVPSASGNYRRFIDLRGANSSDPLVRDAQERAAR